MIRLIDIEKIVSDAFEISPDTMRKSQATESVLPRQIAIFLSREYTICTLERIGEHFGVKRGAVMNAIDKVDDLINSDKSIRMAVAELQVLIEKYEYKNEKKEAILSDLNTFQKKLNSGNIGHSKLALGQIILNIETLL